MDSVLPLKPPTSSKPVNLSLTSEGDAYVPQRPLVDVTLPEQSLDPIVMPDADLSVRVLPMEANGSGGVAASPVEDRGLFYAEIAEDTDMFVVPQTTGVELFIHLRSAESPETITLHLRTPPGTRLVDSRRQPGSVEVVDDEGRLRSSISAPIAADANGNVVASDLRVADNNDLVLTTPHGDKDAYPLLVDPAITDQYAWSTGSNFSGWTSYESDADYQQWAFGPNLTVPAGLYHTAPANLTFSASSLSLWTYFVPHGGSLYFGATPTNAYIADAYFGSSAFSTPSTGPTSPRMMVGLWSTGARRWVRRRDWTSAVVNPGAWLSSWSPLISGTQASEAKRLDFQLYTPPDVTATTTGGTRQGRIGDVTVSLSDTDEPTATITGVSGWLHENQAQRTLTVTARDGGLGVKSVSLIDGWDQENQLRASQPSVEVSCSGGARSPCPESAPHDFTIDLTGLREGLQAALAVPADALAKATLAGQHYGIDRSPPVVEDIEIVEESNGMSTVHVEAVDGNAGGRDGANQDDLSNAQSGVRSVSLRVDGVLPGPSYQVEHPCVGDGIDGNGSPSSETPWQSCPLSASFTLPREQLSGAHDVAVVVRDEVGHETSIDPRTFMPEAPVNVRSSCADPTFDEGDVDAELVGTDPVAIDAVGASMFGARYSGSYIDGGCPEEYVPLVRDATASELADLEAALAENPQTADAPVDAQASLYTEAQLDATADAAADSLDAMGKPEYFTATDLSKDAVTVATPEPLTQAEAEQVREDVSAVRQESLASPPVPVSASIVFETDTLLPTSGGRADYPPYLGGLQLGFAQSRTSGAPGPRECTSGFMFRKNHHEVGSTAGHCHRSNPTVAAFVGGPEAGWRYVGSARPGWNALSGEHTTADARLYDMKDKFATRRLRGSYNFTREVTGIMHNGEMKIGQHVCFYGMMSDDNNCGPIRYFVNGSKARGVTINKTVCIKQRGTYGDSGGPAFVVRPQGGVKAAGMVLGGTTDGSLSCFSRIDEILKQLNVNLPQG